MIQDLSHDNLKDEFHPDFFKGLKSTYQYKDRRRRSYKPVLLYLGVKHGLGGVILFHIICHFNLEQGNLPTLLVKILFTATIWDPEDVGWVFTQRSCHFFRSRLLRLGLLVRTGNIHNIFIEISSMSFRNLPKRR